MEKYFVATNDEPEKIHFTKEEAFITEPDFVDVFDENGDWVTSYKFDGDNWVDMYHKF